VVRRVDSNSRSKVVSDDIEAAVVRTLQLNEGHDDIEVVKLSPDIRSTFDLLLEFALLSSLLLILSTTSTSP
jgi:hypothetical protein